MNIELTILISICTLVFGFLAAKRNFTGDIKQDTTEMTTVIVKLENIQSGVSEIKNDLKNVKEDIKEIDRRLTINEQIAKSAQKRIDEIKGVH